MLRRDASSDFPKDNRADLFSSLTAGWKISDEDFLKDNKTINFLKLRGSYGTKLSLMAKLFMYLTDK